MSPPGNLSAICEFIWRQISRAQRMAVKQVAVAASCRQAKGPVRAVVPGHSKIFLESTLACILMMLRKSDGSAP